MLFFNLLLLNPFKVLAQEENVTIVKEGTKYLDLRIKSLEKYNERLKKQQDKLLKKLRRKEAKLSSKLKATDSAAYVRFQSQQLTYDSISKVSNPDSTELAKVSHRRNKVIDSLKGIQSFVKDNASKLTQADGGITNVGSSGVHTGSYTSDINKLQGELNYRQYINDLISQRTNNLKSLSSSSNIPMLGGIQKEVFYGKAKMNVFKQIEEDPSKAEDVAYEYLQGSEGFDKAIAKATNPGSGMQSLAGNENADMLQQMGYQTKGQVQANLQRKFGANLGNVSQSMNQQVNQYQDKLKELNNAKQAKQSFQQLRNTEKPAFKVNPMRGMPFWKRIDYQYNWQSTRATVNTPALLEMSVMAGYKQSKKLAYGLGLATSIGLGQSWSNIHFSFQGLGLRSYLTWQWQYGFGLYGGYERMYKQAVFVGNTASSSPSVVTDGPHNTNNYSESILLGLTKSYHMNDKWNGQIQLLYDVWWQQKGMRSPLVLRFATVKK
jgi:hypothetical protein